MSSPPPKPSTSSSGGEKSVRFSGSSTSRGSTGLDMDQETARALLDNGAYFVFLDVPPGTEFGIDFPSWNTGERFLGVKMIPPGVHYVYWSAVNTTYRQTGPRTGFFHNFASRELVVKRYVPADEEVVDVGGEEKERIRTNLRNMDSGMGPYPYDEWKKWVSLTNRISPATIARLEPTVGLISSESEMLPEEHFTSRKDKKAENMDQETSNPQEAASNTGEGSGSKRTSSSRLSRDDDKLPKMTQKPGTEIRYTHVPAERYPAGSTPAEITKHSMDSSFQVETYLDAFNKLYGDRVSSSMSDINQTDEILSELQFSFVCFLVGQHYDSFEHWKRLLRMFCSCHDAIAKHTDLYLQLISDIHFQIREVPDDFFVDIVSKNNFLVSLLANFFATVRSNEAIDTRLKDRAVKFQANLSKKFDWDFDQELDEDAPVVVDLENST